MEAFKGETRTLELTSSFTSLKLCLDELVLEPHMEKNKEPEWEHMTDYLQSVQHLEAPRLPQQHLVQFLGDRRENNHKKRVFRELV